MRSTAFSRTRCAVPPIKSRVARRITPVGAGESPDPNEPMRPDLKLAAGCVARPSPTTQALPQAPGDAAPEFSPAQKSLDPTHTGLRIN